jgi:hypothetical protein
MRFQVNGFNTGSVSVTGPGGVFGYGPLPNTGGILIDTKQATPDDNWSVEFNTYPAHYRSDAGDHVTVIPNNLSLSKGGRNTSVRFFYSQVYQPRQKAGDGSTKMFNNQAGVAFATGIKRLHFNSTIVAQKYKSERYRNNSSSYTSKNVDVTAKGRLVYELYPVLNLSALGGYDLNTYEMNSKTTRKRIFYHPSLNFNKTFETFGIFGSVAYQRDSSSMEDSHYSYSPQRRFKTSSFIGTLGFSFRDFLWIRSTIQSNELSVRPRDRKTQPSYFASLDVIKAANLQAVRPSKFLLRANYNNAYNYAGLLAVKLNNASYSAFLNNQTSFETGLDLGIRRTGIAITYFQQRWNHKKEDCPENSGDCGVTPDVLQNITLDGVEVKLDQEIPLRESGRISATAGGMLTWQLQQANGFSYIQKNTYIFLNTAIFVSRFYGSVMVSKEDPYDMWDFNADVPVPLREISVGYHVPEIDSKLLRSARISFNGRNFVTGTINRFGTSVPYRLYAMNFHLKFR